MKLTDEQLLSQIAEILAPPTFIVNNRERNSYEGEDELDAKAALNIDYGHSLYRGMFYIVPSNIHRDEPDFSLDNSELEPSLFCIFCQSEVIESRRHR